MVYMDFTNLSTLSGRMNGKVCLDTYYQVVISGWNGGKFIEAERDQTGNVQKVLYTYQVIDEQKRREQEQLQDLKNTYRDTEKQNKEKTESLEHDKKALSDTLQYQNSFVKILLDQINCGVMAYTVPGRNLLQINREALRLFGCENFDAAREKLRAGQTHVIVSLKDQKKLLKFRKKEGSVVYRFTIRSDHEEERQILAERSCMMRNRRSWNSKNWMNHFKSWAWVLSIWTMQCRR